MKLKGLLMLSWAISSVALAKVNPDTDTLFQAIHQDNALFSIRQDIDFNEANVYHGGGIYCQINVISYYPQKGHAKQFKKGQSFRITKALSDHLVQETKELRFNLESMDGDSIYNFKCKSPYGQNLLSISIGQARAALDYAFWIEN